MATIDYTDKNLYPYGRGGINSPTIENPDGTFTYSQTSGQLNPYIPPPQPSSTQTGPSVITSQPAESQFQKDTQDLLKYTVLPSSALSTQPLASQPTSGTGSGEYVQIQGAFFQRQPDGKLAAVYDPATLRSLQQGQAVTGTTTPTTQTVTKPPTQFSTESQTSAFDQETEDNIRNLEQIGAKTKLDIENAFFHNRRNVSNLYLWGVS